jgi:hypothetical protein
MASIIGHAFAGLAIGWIWRLLSNWNITWWMILICGVLGMAPDMDMFLFFMGVEYLCATKCYDLQYNLDLI